MLNERIRKNGERTSWNHEEGNPSGRNCLEIKWIRNAVTQWFVTSQLLCMYGGNSATNSSFSTSERSQLEAGCTFRSAWDIFGKTICLQWRCKQGRFSEMLPFFKLRPKGSVSSLRSSSCESSTLDESKCPHFLWACHPYL